jgi:hypothetical protein
MQRCEGFGVLLTLYPTKAIFTTLSSTRGTEIAGHNSARLPLQSVGARSQVDFTSRCNNIHSVLLCIKLLY